MARAALRLIDSARRSEEPLRHLDDARLVALAQGRDRLALEALYRRHAGFALNLAVRLLGNAADSEDIVHNGFLRAFNRIDELRQPGAFRSWLGTIVVQEVRGQLRRNRLMTKLGLANDTVIDLDSLAAKEASPEARAQLAQIYTLLQLMPADLRIAWTLREVERHRLEEVAELSGCSLATAKRRIQRAQQFMQQHFVSAGES